MPIELPQHRNDTCPFCTNIMGGSQTAVVFENDAVFAFLNPRQFGLGHTLVIPRRHAPTVLDLEAGEMAALAAQVHRIANAISLAFDPSGLNIFQNNGVTAGQTVAHYHVHIVPTYPGAEPGRIFHSEDFERTPYEERLATAARIIEQLATL
jgi:histidine triad (HIT) family protein